jgi:hypothetical protein
MPMRKRTGPVSSSTSFVAAALMALPLLLAPAAARAATTIVVQRGKEAPSTIYADKDRLRMEAPEGISSPMGGKAPGGAAGRDTSVIIVDAVARKMVMVNDREKTFTEITEDDMKRMKAQLQAARAQMAERTKNMTPEQRAQMESMMGPAAKQMLSGDSKPPQWKFEPLGSKKTVNGFACEMYRVLLDGAVQEEDCISPWSAGLVDRAAFSGLEKFAKSMEDGVGAMRGAMPMFHQFPGLPITRVVISPGGERSEEHQVKSISHGAIAASLFAIPAGYTKRELPQLGMGAGMGHGPGMGKKPGARPGPPAAGSPPPSGAPAPSAPH